MKKQLQRGKSVFEVGDVIVTSGFCPRCLAPYKHDHVAHADEDNHLMWQCSTVCLYCGWQVPFKDWNKQFKAQYYVIEMSRAAIER